MPSNLLRSLCLALGLLCTLTLAHAQETMDPIQIQFRRPEKVGDKSVIETSYTSETTIYVDALNAPSVLEDVKAYEKVTAGYKQTTKRTGKVEREVKALNDKGQAEEVALKVLTITQRQGRESQQTSKEPFTVNFKIPKWGQASFDGAKIEGFTQGSQEQGAREILSQIILGMDNYDFDAVFGTAEKKRPGDTWAVDRHALMEVLSAGKWKPERALDLEGEVKFQKVMVVNAKPCAIIEAVTKINEVRKGIIIGVQPREVEKADLELTVRVALPLDGTSQGRVLASTLKGRVTFRPESGGKPLAVDILESRAEEKVKPAEEKKGSRKP